MSLAIKDGMFPVSRDKNYFKNNIKMVIEEYHNKIIGITSLTAVQMDKFNNKHHQIYELFYPKEEIERMEKYHNQARILSANVGRLFDKIVKFIITDKEGGQSEYIDNYNGHPKKFEIDVMNHHKKIAYEIKWRDAGTDGDHKAKEYRKVDTIVALGYKPIRLTFYLPELMRSANSQRQIIEYYNKFGESYTEDKAFEYVNKLGGIDLMKILNEYKGLGSAS
jgi:hypothetical protein